MSVQQRRRYDPEFKRHEVLLNEEAGRSVREVAEKLGIDNRSRMGRRGSCPYL